MHSPRRLALALGLAVALVAAPARAQDKPPADPPHAPQADVPAELASARATMRTFLTAIADAAGGRPARLAEAAGCLDLREINESVRREKGAELAIQLKGVLDKIRLVDFDELPDDPDGRPHVFYRHPDGLGAIVLARTKDGRWLFTAETVDAIVPLARALDAAADVAGATAVPFHLAPALWIRAHVPPRLRQTTFVLEHWQWLGLLVLALLGVLADRLLSSALAWLTRRRLRRRGIEVEADVAHQGLRPFGLLAMALVWRVGDNLLALPLHAHNFIIVAVNFIAAAAGVWGAYRVVDLVAAAAAARAAQTSTKVDDLLVPLLRKTAKVFVTAMGLVFVAETTGVEVQSLIAGLGLGGLAFALAAQDTVKNLFGSVTVVIDRTFQVGDWVVIGGDVEGTVEEVGFRSTRVRTFYDSLVTIPNALLLTSKVDNMGARRHRRWRTLVSITYDTPADTIEAFCEGIRELVRKHPCTRKDYQQVWVNAFGPSSIDILVYVFHEVPDWTSELRERQRLLLDIVRLAARMGVEFAFPTQTLHVQQLAGAAPRREVRAQRAGLEGLEELHGIGRKEAARVLAASLGTGELPASARLGQLVEREDRGDGGE